MMEFKHQTSTLSLIFLLMMPGFALSDVNQDKAECSNQLVGLAPCLPYVGGEAKTPTIDCCSGLKQVLDKSKKCLCVLIKDKDDPTSASMAECISLLHLAPNSQEAKLFEGYQKLTEGHGSTPAATGNSTSRPSSAAEKSDGGQGKRWVGVEMATGISLLIFYSIYRNIGV
uniref:Bifunctional inhibitor/plant lipid transfer protein/seed storage helical domain-containing protein n=1 Tax=Gossypium raimondii TaxID=29730 RepID=A0A0D2R716_GOSRA|nr:hypothetical protein B456_010G127100 [Gossypium raimondii]